MMKVKVVVKSLVLVLMIISIWGCSSDDQISFSTETFTLAIDQQGNMTEMVDKSSGKNYLAVDQPATLLSVRKDGQIYKPSSLRYDKENELINLLFDPTDATVNVSVKNSPSHISFEIIEVDPMENIEMVIWGPYPTTINTIIGETVGVVRGEEFAMGIQALNPKTLGGFPWKENDCMPQLDIFEGDDYTDLSEEGKRYVLYRVEAAKPEDFGSTLQAYCRNRNNDRIIENWNHETYLAPAYDDGGVVGSKIAIFGCPVDQTLDYIEKIELAEGLPHPIIDGEWGKKAKTANSSYLILGFGEEDIDKALEYTKMAGLRYLYHPGPFKNWGHFELNDQFPNGYEGMKTCVNKAESQEVHLGVHTLSNFITTNDPYVTPVPDDRLAKVGSNTIVEDIDETQKEIAIDSPGVFKQMKNNNLKTVVIGNELIRYGGVSEAEPWKLLDCQRGAYETKPAVHEKDSKIELLADHGYKVFLTDAELTKEIAKNIADLYNQTGLRQISFDGLEGNRSTGMGNYGEILMANTWYDKLNEDIKSHYIADASRTSHYFWHIYSRMNWGEPWYAGFRESQTEYRFKNQKYFQRNLMPGMLGWFLMTNETSLEDIEWMLAKAAGYNAGFGFVSSYKSFEENGLTKEILDQINLWENARLNGKFDENTREQLKDVSKEFHLEVEKDNELLLQEIYSFTAVHEKKERQPGEPVFSNLSFNLPDGDYKLGFTITAIDGSIKDIKLEINNYKEINLPVTLKDGETIKFSGDSPAIVYNQNWKKINDLNMEGISLSTGDHTITMDCTFLDGKEPKLKLEVRLAEEPIIIQSN